MDTTTPDTKKRVLIITCSLLFFIGLIALIAGLFLWRAGTDTITDNTNVTPSPVVTTEPKATKTPTTTPKVTPSTSAKVKVLQEASRSDKTYTGGFFTVFVPAGWRVVQRGNEIGSKSVRIEKGDYSVFITATESSSEGAFYPYNGVCASERLNGDYSSLKFQRIDNVFDAKNSGYADWACNLDKTVQTGDKVWLGSRLIDKDSANPWISPYKYFGASATDQACSSVAYFILYQHSALNDIRAKYPVWDSNELNNMLKEMDTIAGSVVFTKGASFFCHNDGLG